MFSCITHSDDKLILIFIQEKKMKTIIAALSLALVATPVFAAKSYDSGSVRSSKGYIGIAAGKNTVASSDTATYAASTATSVFGGYSFTDRFAVEAAYVNLGTAVATDIASSTEYNVPATLMSVSAVGTLPMGQVFSLYGKLGVGQSKVGETSPETNTGVVYGIGGLFNVGQRAGIRVGYDSFKVGSTTPVASSTISVGVLFKF
jgi:hypothetical protein